MISAGIMGVTDLSLGSPSINENVAIIIVPATAACGSNVAALVNIKSSEFVEISATDSLHQDLKEHRVAGGSPGRYDREVGETWQAANESPATVVRCRD